VNRSKRFEHAPPKGGNYPTNSFDAPPSDPLHREAFLIGKIVDLPSDVAADSLAPLCFDNS
jgi:hypothetical protein